jgi:hypothetical protein
MSESEATAVCYLRDTGALVREAALDAWIQAPAGSADPFEAGRAIALYEVASLMARQAEAFGLPPSAISFEGFDPDRDLLNGHARAKQGGS